MKREEKQEIRRVLLGKTMIAEDGRLVAMEKGQTRLPLGVSDGAGATFFFGLCKKARRLKASCSEEKAKALALARMEKIGRVLYLPKQPAAAACLIRYVLTRPTVLVFDYLEGVPVLTAWAGRGLTGWISNRRALKAFLKDLPKQLKLSEEAVPEDKDPEKAEKRRRKEARKARKQAKKQKKGRQRPTEQADEAETGREVEQ